MKKNIMTIIVILFLIGIFSVTVSINGFFFTTKYYNNSLSAYNADAGYNAVYGEEQVESEIGVFEIDEENALFLGEITEGRFVVAEMSVKNKKYAHRGAKFFYDYTDVFDVNHYNQMETKAGNIKWIVVYDHQDLKKLSKITSVKEYSLSNGSPLFLVIFE